MRGAPAWRRRYSVQHPSSVSALRADPPSPTGGEGKSRSPSAHTMLTIPHGTEESIRGRFLAREA
ncbi:hypothetical protein C9427_25850 [Mesorhizobium helmanticense]|uniref:Uncharacterized protein n=1 Tax=Mesorhizobium helmanticense TaxID=1776423 RepID=A0A2T4IPH5_9HYPH|nr:hypothetical protein C9427_25850 [Mesorhizobium helmanticense]